MADDRTSTDAPARDSRLPGFYRLSPAERLARLEQAGIVDLASGAVYRDGGLSLADADVMVENVISTFALPNGAAVNFRINGIDRVVPMVVEEPSVVAALSHMAKLARATGGFRAEADPSVMIGQVQVVDVADPEQCIARLRGGLARLRDVAAAVHPRIAARGGGIRDFEIRRLDYDEPGHPPQAMVVLHFHYDCVDAMGANLVNTVAEHLAPHVEALTGARVGLKILSNLADRRLARAWVSLPAEVLGKGELDGALVAERIAEAWRFAWADPYRAATHNKGVMNGIDGLAVATGNDWRAIEAGAHAWCARGGTYRPLTSWRVADGLLHGHIELPLQLATVGGSTGMHPTVRANLDLLGVTTSRELSAIAAAVGLAQNLGALRALATEGIQAGHMRMHARTVAATAGAGPHELDEVTARLCEDRDYSVDRARRVLAELRGG